MYGIITSVKCNVYKIMHILQSIFRQRIIYNTLLVANHLLVTALGDRFLPPQHLAAAMLHAFGLPLDDRRPGSLFEAESSAWMTPGNSGSSFLYCIQFWACIQFCSGNYSSIPSLLMTRFLDSFIDYCIWFYSSPATPPLHPIHPWYHRHHSKIVDSPAAESTSPHRG